MSDDHVPDHTAEVCVIVADLDAMVVASPGRPHVTVVHSLDDKDAVDQAITDNGLRGERIDDSRVKVFPA